MLILGGEEHITLPHYVSLSLILEKMSYSCCAKI